MTSVAIRIGTTQFADFRILMDGAEEIKFWTDRLSESKEDARSGIDEDAVDAAEKWWRNLKKQNVSNNEKESPTPNNTMIVIEQIWTTRYGFVIEMTVRKSTNFRKMTSASMMSSASHSSSQAEFDVDLSEIGIIERIIYYVSPFMNMVRIPFPNTNLTQEQFDQQRHKRYEKDQKMRSKNPASGLSAEQLERSQQNEDILKSPKSPKSMKSQKFTKSSESPNSQKSRNSPDSSKDSLKFEFVPKAQQQVTRFIVGQHGTTKQLLLWDRFDNGFYILDEHQLHSLSVHEYQRSYTENKHEQRTKFGSKLSAKARAALCPKFDLPFGHIGDRSRRVEWRYICRFDLPNEAFFDPTRNIPDTVISRRFQTVRETMKIWGHHDWICVLVTHDVYYIHLTNIVLHRRYLFHQYSHYKKEQNREREADQVQMVCGGDGTMCCNSL